MRVMRSRRWRLVWLYPFTAVYLCVMVTVILILLVSDAQWCNC